MVKYVTEHIFHLNYSVRCSNQRGVFLWRVKRQHKLYSLSRLPLDLLIRELYVSRISMALLQHCLAINNVRLLIISRQPHCTLFYCIKFFIIKYIKMLYQISIDLIRIVSNIFSCFLIFEIFCCNRHAMGSAG